MPQQRDNKTRLVGAQTLSLKLRSLEPISGPKRVDGDPPETGVPTGRGYQWLGKPYGEARKYWYLFQLAGNHRASHRVSGLSMQLVESYKAAKMALGLPLSHRYR